MVVLMKSVIFLNKCQVRILKEAGIDISRITDAVLAEKLSATDYRSIKKVSEGLQYRDNLLYKYGFRINRNVDELVPDQEYVKSISDNLPLNAVCTDVNTIIIWEETNQDNSNNMFKASILNIVKAMSKVLLHNDLTKTKQFELCFMNY